MSRFILTEPSNIDDEPDAQRCDEEARERNWTSLVAAIRARKEFPLLWSEVIEEASTALFLAEEVDENDSRWWTPSSFEQAYIAFAETEGWPAVFQALSRAMREREAAHVESTDRSTR